MKSIEQYREQYPKGTVLRLTGDLEDPYSPKKAGDTCVVEFIDDAGNIHVHWESGGSIALIIGVDCFEKLYGYLERKCGVGDINESRQKSERSGHPDP